jgi:thiol-disulfide isomerase/thioredoxin
MARRMRAVPLLALTLAVPVAAQQPDLAELEREIDAMFTRPAGQVISAAQKEALAAFVQRHEGQDLGRFGYVRAIHQYFERDVAGAAVTLDAFFARQPAIANKEHSTIAGRIYLGAVREVGQQPDADANVLAGWGRRMVALYPDLSTLARHANAIAPSLREPASFRLGLVRGLLESQAGDADRDQFLQAIYGAVARPDQRGRPDANPPRDTVGGAAPTAGEATAKPAPANGVLAVGALVPDFPIEHAIGAADGFALSKLRGKVVVLEFFATWCPPCRAAPAELQKLAREHGESLAIVGVTRCYGRGMDFADGGKPPHGGRMRSDLAPAEEHAVTRRFAEALAISWPLVFTTTATMRDTFGVSLLPTTAVIGKDGRLLGTVVGQGDDQTAKLREWVGSAAR